LNKNNNQIKDNNTINNNINVIDNNIKEPKNKFHRVKTLGELRKKNIDNLNAENEKKNNVKNDKKNKIQKNNTIIFEKKDKKQRNYNNLYDKYIDKLKDRMNKIEANKNYREEKDTLYNNNNRPQDINKKKIFNKMHNFRRTYTCRELEKNKNIKKEREYSQGEILKENPDKNNINNRKRGKSIGNANKNNNQVKNKGKENNKKNEERKSRKDNALKNTKRSKSLGKLIGNINIKNVYEEKDDIESVMYDKVGPSKDDDPFDDVDTVVKAINFNCINLFSKNIFREDNEKYKNYCQKFDNIFNKFIINNNQRKNVNNNEKNENNENSISNLQSEKTTDSFKKNQINMSFIENQK
jgi:hypothetical protein